MLWIGAVEVPVILTTPALVTEVAYGRLLTVTLCTPVVPMMLLLQLVNVCAVRLSVAVPGAVGLLSTLALKVDAAHFTPVVPVVEL